MFWYNVKGYYSKIDFRHCFANSNGITISLSKQHAKPMLKRKGLLF